MEKVSLIIPCYNVELFVEKCVDSVVRQSYEQLEIICIDDGSSDETWPILENLSKTDSRIKIFTQQNKGLSETRNVGISLASGQYLIFLDGDDWLERDTVEKTLTDGYDLICFSYNRIFKNAVQPRIFNLSGEFDTSHIQRRILGLIGKELTDPSQANSLVTACAKIYNTSVIKLNGLKFTDTREIGTEDALFNLQYLECCEGMVRIIDKPYYNYLRHNCHSLTTTYKPDLIEQWSILHHKMISFTQGKDENFRQAYYNRIALSLIGLGLNEMESKDNGKKIRKRIALILNQPEYIQAYQNLEYRYFPLHWRLLFQLAKKRNTAGVFLMMKLMSFLWKRKNR